MRHEELHDATKTVHEGIKDEAVRLIRTSGRSRQEIAEDLRIILSTLAQ